MKMQKTIAIALVSLGIIGGAFLLGNQESLNKIITKKPDLQTIKEKQLDELKKHEEEIKDFVKSQNSKIESVQVDWNQTNWEEVGNGTPWGAGEIVNVYGRFNHIEDSSWNVTFLVKDNEVVPNSMSLANDLYVGGRIFE
ncbi:protein of hypothetical function/lipoprotein [Streptococcus sanguinis SK1 = NCTC 7863]|jgi:hypothetical protein|uniref:hypothetical protein n=1 Tax=Streptococcus sanguinis TaxID=1305 RepID=UPI000204C8B4|nr:hypothetical protein [Streptococcus sanguinis]EGF05855.1 protein of hypothetical function/lipoprotein [Streptococcus sanguinis SK1 = NCTC 7863]EGF22491.1 protein of hypothetical function/lipoprotein [Streptococcus sanguinis SK1058]MBZ2076038.1 hypothetical protein [Streptococcus sanguinis]SQG31129.1 lipoprotein [Streptococcus sanguinis]